MIVKILLITAIVTTLLGLLGMIITSIASDFEYERAYQFFSRMAVAGAALLACLFCFDVCRYIWTRT